METPKRKLDALAAALVEAEPGDQQSITVVLTRLGEVFAALGDSPFVAEAEACQAALSASDATPDRIARALQRLTVLVGDLQKPVPTGSTADLVDNKLLGEFFSGQREANEQLEADLLAMERGDTGRLDPIKRRFHTLKGEAGVLGLTALAKAYHSVEDFLQTRPDTVSTVSTLLAFKDWVDRVGTCYVEGRPPPPANEILDALEAAANEARLLSVAVAPAASPNVPPIAPAAAAPATAEPADHRREGSPRTTTDSSSAQTAREAAPASPDRPEAPTPSSLASPSEESARLVSITASADSKPGTSGQGQPLIITAVATPAVSRKPEPAASASMPVSNAPVTMSGRVRERVERTDDTIALLTEFIHESEEGLTNADQILMKAEGAGSDAQAVRGLFGVFHTIKGVAGFLDLHEIAELAHATENVLAACRDGKMSLGGPPLNIVFDATAAMRSMVRNVKLAVERRGAIAPCVEAAQVVERLRALLSTTGVESKRPPSKRHSLSVPSPEERAARRTARPATAQSADRQAAQPSGTAEPAAEPRASQVPAVKLRETVKVDVERIDGLIEMIGELVIAESMVSNAPDLTRNGSPRLRNALAQLKKITRDLQDAGLRMRMVTLQGIFRKMARLVRDLGQKTGKSVRIELAGEATEMDRSMVEQIADPLLHIIRNAVDHGIEFPDRRAALGKPETGTIGLSAYHEGGSIVIEIADDGQGLDRDAILAKARNVGIVSPQAELSDSDTYALIFAPGFSTASSVTEISGRGVGMDVVKRNVEAMRGRVVVQTERGKGTTLKIYLPLTLAIIDGTLIACGAEQYIVPTLSVVESVKPTTDMVLTVGGRNEMLNLRGKILPLQRLDRLFEIAGARQDACDQLVVVVESSTGRIGILVDEVITQQHVVIKSLGAGLGATPFATGAAILADGRIGLILNIEELCQTALGRTFGASGIPRRGSEGEIACKRVAH